ncbi:outer membrane protein assembly factor BamD [Loktanella sp. SALINAS62]|uniref:outer membrane protein assembly factor BamD n=1 Tax=Loktanella sp. SALINAS62 TaxID=2706124 RepID=UPI001B8B7A69|nr:outer membrane protein assembly factor BamD [Loktanella sp. SALINAS62]MBS1303808.1 outer membrane protein assembly factor BamD [Loktanella sp. SALINAS62]
MSGTFIRSGVTATVLSLTLLAGCGDGFDPRRAGALESLNAQQIYQLGEVEVETGDPGDAAFYFGEIERLYPYSEWAERALIMQAFAYHRDADYPNSRAAAQRFLDFYPAQPDAAYAQYLLALSYYDQIDEIGRDQGLTFQALQSLRAVIEQYPDSEYARASILKFDLAFDHLAAKEMEIGRYYLKRGNYAAAVNRFRIVVEEFQTTSQTPEALHRLVEAYLSLGLTDEAQTAGAILGNNYPATEWYLDSYALLTGQGLEARAQGDSWLASIYRQVVRGEWL